MRSWQVLAVATTAALLTLSSCGDGGGAPPNTEEDGANEPVASDPGPVHIHGLGVNPSDQSLFIATHTGLFRIPEGEDEATRVGNNYQDTMGFTVVGPDRFLGSGHPDGRQDLPPFLGLIESSDAGEKWRSRSLLGEADFHVLEAAGNRVYGFGSDWKTRQEQFLVSRDGGDEWQELDPPEALISLAINPANSDDLLASGRRTLMGSSDGGASWETVAGEPGLVSWPESDVLYLVTQDGRVGAATQLGSEWTFRGITGGAPAAFEATGPDELFAGLHDGSIIESTDGGTSWSVRSTP